jgi:hypothetical protein
VLLYTGVVRRPDAPPGMRPSSLAVSELCYEQQLAAVAADPGEGLMRNDDQQEATALSLSGRSARDSRARACQTVLVLLLWYLAVR